MKHLIVKRRFGESVHLTLSTGERVRIQFLPPAPEQRHGGGCIAIIAPKTVKVSERPRR